MFHKRKVDAAFINRYNRDLLIAWEANIDVQFVTNTFACAKYCVGYILKADGGISKLMRAANKSATGNQEIKDKLKAMSKVLLNSTEISAQEAASFLLGTPNCYGSKQTVYINTAPPDQRTRILKSEQDLLQMEDDNEEVCEKNVLDRYVSRPQCFDNMTLAHFASNYEYEPTKRKNTRLDLTDDTFIPDTQTTEDYDTDSEICFDPSQTRKMPRYRLLDGSGFVRKRKHPKVVRFRSYGLRSDPINFWREQLMLFLPWRDEEAELLNVNSIEKGCLNASQIEENSKPFYHNRKINETDIRDSFLNAENELVEETEEQEENLLQVDEDFLADAMVDSNSAIERTEMIENFLPPYLIPDIEYKNIMRSLNEKQRRFVLDILHKLKTSDEQFNTFLNGGAGVGKSLGIRAIVQSVLRFFNSQPGNDPSKLPVIVMAFTGRAAFNVLGMTIHHTLRMAPLQKHVGNSLMKDLDASTLNTLRSKLSQLKLIIIDEISMVSVQMLYQIDQRLRQIFAVDTDFGGIPILVVGHFRQLPPIGGAFVFANPSHCLAGAVCDNYLWNNNFRFYEFDEIMRQRGDDVFCKALNNMSEGIMDTSDIAIIKSREITDNLVPPVTAVWLFKTNRECAEYNAKFHSSLPGEGADSVAIDKVQGIKAWLNGIFV